MASLAVADEGDMPAGSAKATVSIHLVIPPAGESRSEFRHCADSLAQQGAGQPPRVPHLDDRCDRNFDVVLVSGTDDVRRRIIPI